VPAEESGDADDEGEPRVDLVVTDSRRRPRRSRPRARTESVRALRHAGIEVLHADDLEHIEVQRPATRADCRDGMRPCPWVACSKHLYLDINGETGSVTFNFPDLEPWDLAETCSLDVAERGAITLEEVGLVMNLTRERIRQLEVISLLKLKRDSELVAELREHS